MDSSLSKLASATKANLDNIDVFSFYLDSTLYSVRIANILNLGQGNISPRPVPGHQESLEGLVDYQGVPVPLFDLAVLLGTEAKHFHLQALSKTLLARKQDHIDWMNALEESIKSGVVFTKARDHHKCAFGIWYDKFETEDDELRDLLKSFDQPHKRIHNLAEHLLSLSEDQKHSEALAILSHERETTFLLLLGLFDRVNSHLNSLARTVILYTTIDGKTPLLALKIGDVSDAHSYTQDQLSVEGITAYQNDDAFVEGFLSDDRGNISVLLDVDSIKNSVISGTGT